MKSDARKRTEARRQKAILAQTREGPPHPKTGKPTRVPRVPFMRRTFPAKVLIGAQVKDGHLVGGVPLRRRTTPI